MTRRQSRSGQETRERIIDAALTTVSTEGLVGTSARVIARTGGFNQALVFYHFGSVDELLLAALERANTRRIERFRPRLADVSDLRELVQVALELQDTANESDDSALAGILAGWSTNSDLGPKVREILEPWDEMVTAALERCLAGTPIGAFVPTDDLAHAISAMFLGMQLMRRFYGDDSRTDSLLTALAGAATFAGPLLDALVAAQRPETAEPIGPAERRTGGT